MVQPFLKLIWRFLKKLEIDPAMPLLGMYPKDTPPYHKDTSSTMFLVALFVIARPSSLTSKKTQIWILQSCLEGRTIVKGGRGKEKPGWERQG